MTTEAHSMRLGLCEVCAAQEARYACPKCEVKTCSLSCVQIHKRELQCDGVRDRTRFLTLGEMTPREFMSDYCFLEDCTRYTEHRKADKSKRLTHINRCLPQPLHRMRLAAQRRSMRLELLLPHFSRRKENTTYLDWRESRFYWRVEWLFVNTPTQDIARFADPRCDETVTLLDLVRKYVDVAEATAVDHRKVLAHHQTAGLGQVSFWLRAEGVRCSGSRCFPLAAGKSLKANLKGKTVVEFPSIFVNYNDSPPAGYEPIDSDDELEVEVAVVKQQPAATASPMKSPSQASEEEELELPGQASHEPLNFFQALGMDSEKGQADRRGYPSVDNAWANQDDEPEEELELAKPSELPSISANAEGTSYEPLDFFDALAKNFGHVDYLDSSDAEEV